MENRVLISVIVPVYNSENTIAKCISSIVTALKNINSEIIIVNDGSTDGTYELINEMKKKYPRLSIYNNKNNGVSFSRNFGIEKSKGEWIAFVDSDDEVSTNYFQIFFENLLISNQFELFFGNVEQLRLDGSSFIEYKHPDAVVSIKKAVLEHRLLLTGDIHAKVFKRSVILDNFLKFDSMISYGEDRLFIDKYLLYVSHICFSNVVCYKYIRNNEGLSYKLFSIESEIKWFVLMSCTLSKLANILEIGCNETRLIGISFRFLGLIPSQCNFKQFTQIVKSLPVESRYYLDLDLKIKYRKVPAFAFIMNVLGLRFLFFLLKMSNIKKRLWKRVVL